MTLRRSVRATALAVAGLIALAACSTGDRTAAPAATGSSSAASFPVTLDHAFGSTTISAAPTRVVTWGWGSTEAALALGVVPVAIQTQSYGADADGVMPWVAQELTTLGASTPTLLTNGDAPPYEEIVAARPDVILAPYSGITSEQYDLLSQIAPTVAYTGKAWTTPWREVITMVGAALGRSEQASTLVSTLDATLADTAAAHPELTGKTVAAVWDAAGTFYVYRPADARVGFLLDLGLTSAPSVDALANGDSSFYSTLSYEQLDKLDADIVVAYADTQDQADAFLTSAATSAIPAVRRGAVAQVVGAQYVAAVSPPTALSLTWGLDDLVTALSAAAAKS